MAISLVSKHKHGPPKVGTSLQLVVAGLEAYSVYGILGMIYTIYFPNVHLKVVQREQIYDCCDDTTAPSTTRRSRYRVTTYFTSSHILKVRGVKKKTCNIQHLT